MEDIVPWQLFYSKRYIKYLTISKYYFHGFVLLSNIHSIIIVFLKKWVFEHVVRQKGKVVIV